MVTGNYKNPPLESIYAEVNTPISSHKPKEAPSWQLRKPYACPPIIHEELLWKEKATIEPPGAAGDLWFKSCKNSYQLSWKRDCHYITSPTLHGHLSISESTWEGIRGKVDDQGTILRAAMSAIQKVNPTLTLYTDGSPSEGTSKGGAAVFVTSGNPSSPTIISTI